MAVALVGGFYGAGKTSLLHHFVSEYGAAGPLLIAVEAAGPVNLDAKAMRGLCGAMRRKEDVIVEIPAGMDEEAMASELKHLSSEQTFDRVLVEMSGSTNPARLARAMGEDGGALPEVICVVDALDFYRGTVAPRGKEEAFSDFQRALIAEATLVVLNKCDLIEEAEQEACGRVIRKLNASAALVGTAHGELPWEIWNRKVAAGPTAARSEVGEDEPELGAVVFRVHRPFHPQRFWDWFQADHAGLLRVKGIVWLASRNLLVGGLSRTRWQNSCGGAGIWWAALPREEWPEQVEALQKMQEVWREPYGDRRQELLLLGEAARIGEVAKKLNGCLLTEAELARPVEEWKGLADPFPEWELGGEG